MKTIEEIENDVQLFAEMVRELTDMPPELVELDPNLLANAWRCLKRGYDLLYLADSLESQELFGFIAQTVMSMTLKFMQNGGQLSFVLIDKK